jgi:hypothetical protein
VVTGVIHAPILHPHPRNLRRRLHHRPVGSHCPAVRGYCLRVGTRCSGKPATNHSLRTEYARTNARFLQARAAKGFAILSVFFFLFLLPIERVASRESKLVRTPSHATESDADHFVKASARRGARNICPRTTTPTRIFLVRGQLRW